VDIIDIANIADIADIADITVGTGPYIIIIIIIDCLTSDLDPY